LRTTDQGSVALPATMCFCVRTTRAFLVELLPFSKGIETRKILSRIPPWAAIFDTQLGINDKNPNWIFHPCYAMT